MKRLIGALLVLPLLAAVPAPANGSMPIYIKIDGIVVGPGGEEGRDGGIEVLTFGFGRESIDSCTGAQGAAGRHDLDAVVIMKRIDKSTPLLREALAKGNSFAEVKVEFAERGRGCALVFHTIREMRITQRGDRESITFDYARLDFQPIG